MTDPKQQVEEHIQQFTRERKPDLLLQALAVIGAAYPGVDTAHDQHARRDKLRLWLSVLNAVDRELDPGFDPADVPQLNLAPPVGAALDAGIEPQAIKDPQLRRQ